MLAKLPVVFDQVRGVDVGVGVGVGVGVTGAGPAFTATVVLLTGEVPPLPVQVSV